MNNHWIYTAFRSHGKMHGVHQLLKQLDSLRYYGIVKGVGVTYPAWFEELYNHIKAVEEF